MSYLTYAAPLCHHQTRDIQTPDDRLPWQINFVCWYVLSVGFQHGTWFMSPCWCLGLLRQLLDFWKTCAPLH